MNEEETVPLCRPICSAKATTSTDIDGSYLKLEKKVSHFLVAVKGVISDVSVVEDDLKKSAQSRQQATLVDGAAWSELLSVVARVSKIY